MSVRCEVRAVAVALATGLLGVMLLVRPASGAEAVRFSATIDGTDVAQADSNHPLMLRRDRAVVVAVSVRNDGTDPAVVRSVRLESRVIGLTFFAYETRVDMSVAPGSNGDRKFRLELLDLADQATGLLPARIVLLDDSRHELSSRRLAVDVKGSMTSVYGVFSLLVIAITSLLFVSALVGLATHRLSPNRWSRGARLGTVGLGIGLSLTFSLSALRVLLPNVARWLPLVLVSGAALFTIGYLSPSPTDDDDDDHADEDELEEASTAGSTA